MLKKLLKLFYYKTNNLLTRFCYKHMGKNSSLPLRGRRIRGGKRIYIGSNTHFWYGFVRIQCYKGATVKIGNDCSINSFLTILTESKVIIGNDVLIASYVSFFTGNHNFNVEDERPYSKQGNTSSQGIVIEDGCYIGEKASIIGGVTIGEHSVIGTNAVVTKDIPPYSMAVGIPAHVIKKWDFNLHAWVNCDEN